MMTGSWHDLALRTVTPAFLGRFDVADPEPADVPFPIPSLRGVLAYWFRALAGAYIGNNNERLYQAESAVFGSARKAGAGGPSPILLRAGRVRLTRLSADHPGMRYLMGPGLTAPKEPPPRYLTPGTLTLRVRNNGTPAHGDLFLSALWALRTFGGIGARSRRGFGSLAVDRVPAALPVERFDPTWLKRDTVDDLDAVVACVSSAIRELGITAGDGHAGRYPCFAHGQYRHNLQGEDTLIGSRDWRAALGIAGEVLWGFRHGANRWAADAPPPPGTHSQSYIDVVQSFLNHRPQQGPMTAAALGLPIPYSDHQGPVNPAKPTEPTQRRAMVDVLIDGKPARRASPLWLRVRYDGSAWRLRSLAFYGEWLPASRAELRITSGRRSEPVNLLTDSQVRAELDRWFGPPTGIPS